MKCSPLNGGDGWKGRISGGTKAFLVYPGQVSEHGLRQEERNLLTVSRTSPKVT